MARRKSNVDQVEILDETVEQVQPVEVSEVVEQVQPVEVNRESLDEREKKEGVQQDEVVQKVPVVEVNRESLDEREKKEAMTLKSQIKVEEIVNVVRESRGEIEPLTITVIGKSDVKNISMISASVGKYFKATPQNNQIVVGFQMIVDFGLIFDEKIPENYKLTGMRLPDELSNSLTIVGYTKKSVKLMSTVNKYAFKLPCDIVEYTFTRVD